MRLSVVSNISVEPFLFPLIRQAFWSHTVEIKFIGWTDVLSTPEREQGSDLIVVLPNLDAQVPNWYLPVGSKDDLRCKLVCECRSVYRALKNNAVCPVIWFGYEGDGSPRYHICGATEALHRFIEELNRHVLLMLEPGDVFLDIRYLLAFVGLTNAYDAKNKYRWNQPYSQTMMQAIAEEIGKQYRILYGPGKKCLILDCDGVLWGGVLAEDGIAGIQLGNEGLGRQYQDFQRFLLSLYQQGILLAVCSKNDLSEVQEVFRTHSGMILKEQNIVCFQANWESKSINIKRIAQTLGISLDSVVFVDDTEAEIKVVCAELPEVLAVPYHRETVYKALSCFSLPSDVDLIRVEQRMNTYRANRQLHEHDAYGEEEDDLLLKETNIDIHSSNLSEAARIAELSQRTNRCTNGKRYSVAEVIACMKNPSYSLFSVNVSDQYSDLGLVGAIGFRDTELDLFSLSCRAFGRGVEKEMLKVVQERNCTNGFFEDTTRNDALKQLLNGLAKLDAAGLRVD